MNRQEHKTTLTDPSTMMISLQLNNLILTPNLKPKTTSHDQSRRVHASPNGLSLPLSVEDPHAGERSEGTGEQREGMTRHEPEARFEFEEIELYITMLETFLQSIEDSPDIPMRTPVQIPGITCPGCNELVGVNHEGKRYLWVVQPQRSGPGIEPESYCSFPYFLAKRILKRHADWSTRLISGCNRCGDELNFFTRHDCSKPNPVSLREDKDQF